MRERLKQWARRLGLYVASTERLGIDVELDLARLSAGTPVRTVFDVGANFGQTARRFAEVFPAAEIYTFEPVPQTFAGLESTVRGMERVHAFNVAMGDRPGVAAIQITGHTGANTLRPVAEATGSVEVTVETVDRVCAEHRVEAIDLLKIDAEGFEVQVLQGAAGMLRAGRVRFVFAECVFSPNSEMPHTSFFALHELLSAHGFCFVGFYAESFHLALGCAMGNVLYALRSGLPASVPGRVRNVV